MFSALQELSERHLLGIFWVFFFFSLAGVWCGAERQSTNPALVFAAASLLAGAVPESPATSLLHDIQKPLSPRAFQGLKESCAWEQEEAELRSSPYPRGLIFHILNPFFFIY